MIQRRNGWFQAFQSCTGLPAAAVIVAKQWAAKAPEAAGEAPWLPWLMADGMYKLSIEGRLKGRRVAFICI